MYALHLVIGKNPGGLERIDEVSVARSALGRGSRAAPRRRFTPARSAPGSGLWVAHAIKYATAYQWQLALRQRLRLLSNFRIAPVTQE